MPSSDTLIVFQHGLGDNLMLTPTVRALRRLHPEGRIGLVLASDCPPAADLWRTNPHVACCFISSLKDHPHYWNPIRFLLLDYWRLRQEAMVLAHQHQFGRVRIVRNQYLPDWLDRALPGLPVHRVDRIAFEVGVKLTDYQYDVFYDETHRQRAAAFLESRGIPADAPLVGLHTMASNVNRSWRLEDVAPLVASLHATHGVRFLHFHSNASSQREAASTTCRLDPRLVVNTAEGNLDILSTAALVARCRAVLAVDSSIAYLANACQVPLVLLCRPKNPIPTRLPRSGRCVGLTQNRYPPEAVLPLAHQLLAAR